MESKQDYIERVQAAIQQLHKCEAVHRGTVPVHEVFDGQTVWKGDVEVFDVIGHPKAKRAYGWSIREGVHDDDERFVAVLDIPPIVSPETAVRASVMANFKRQ